MVTFLFWNMKNKDLGGLAASEILGSEKVHTVVQSLLSQASDEVVESSAEEE